MLVCGHTRIVLSESPVKPVSAAPVNPICLFYLNIVNPILMPVLG